jgi:hypothetical protein
MATFDPRIEFFLNPNTETLFALRSPKGEEGNTPGIKIYGARM